MAGKDNPPGPREWLLAGLHSRWSRFFTHPVVATTMFVSGFYALYFGGIFDSAVSHHGAHILMNLHFLMSGYLFYWIVIGVDPAPRNIPPLGKIAMVFASVPLHAFFGDQQLGGSIAWAAGELPLVVVLLALLIQWQRSDRRDAVRMDRAAKRDDDADLAAYNAMLAQLSGRDRGGN